MRETVLVVDDDGAFRRVWAKLLAAEGYDVAEAFDAPTAMPAFERSRARIVVLDLQLPPSNAPGEGTALLGRMLADRPETKVIVASGAGEATLALSLVRRGAYDYVAKPVDPDAMLAILSRAATRLALEDRVRELETDRAAAPDDSGLVGSAPAFLAARSLADRAAPAGLPVLLTGASGTGKEVFARYIHRRSNRSAKPFVAVNCGAISPQLLESTLFGHKRGAFTGATSDAKGLFVEADGGTLFLDEIGDLAIDLQVKLLRALEAGEVLPVGASKPVAVDVRIISATHQPLVERIAARTFRDDLYWRIRGIEIALPSLAERPGDVVLLAKHFLNAARALVPGAATTTLSPEAIRALEQHAWPGNLRELRHEMQRALVFAAGRGEILPDDLSPAIRGTPVAPAAAVGGTLEEKIAALERAELQRALAETGGNRSHAADLLGLSRQGLLNKLARHGLR